jgi:hypothetical protein
MFLDNDFIHVLTQLGTHVACLSCKYYQHSIPYRHTDACSFVYYATCTYRDMKKKLVFQCFFYLHTYHSCLPNTEHRRDSRGISDIPPRRPRFTKSKSIAVKSQFISGLSAVNRLVAFYDIHGRKREVLFFCFVPHTTRDTKFFSTSHYKYSRFVVFHETYLILTRIKTIAPLSHRIPTCDVCSILHS